MLKKDKKYIVRVMIATALIIGCIMGCGQTGNPGTTQE